MLKIFIPHLKRQLTQKIKGKVEIKVIRDTVFIKITTSEKLEWIISIDNISTELQHGYTSSQCSYDVVKRYKEFIISRYIR